MLPDRAGDLLAFVDRSPSPYHAVAEAERRLAAAGFSRLLEQDTWRLEPGSRWCVVRGDGSLIALQVGSESPADAGFRIVGAHTDSPNLRVKPRPDRSADGYRQLAVEPYGSPLLHTWLDRDLSLAGRVSFRGRGDGERAAVRTALLDFGRPLLRIPSLAIHLQRELPTTGLQLNPQQHLPPVLGLDGTPPLAELVASELRAAAVASIDAADVLGWDLMAYDVQPSCVAGARGEFLLAPRLDNLASCHAAICALLEAAASGAGRATRVVALYDHEEVGSRSAVGAAGPLLESTLERTVAGFKDGAPQGLARAVARSLLVSADMAHAVHPNYSDKHEPGHRPVVGAGPVIKVNANQSYASDAETAARFAALCAEVGVRPQHFVSRSDLGCGSTIGPITAARVGLRTVDVGNPMLSMHSCRELAGVADVAPMIDVLCAFLREDDA
jgi:aspartyl aminopeptidase